MQKSILLAVLCVLSMPALAAQNVLTWDDMSTNETGFSIERKDVACAAGGAFGEIATVGQDVATYTDANVVGGVTYCYRVAAFNQAGASAYSNEAGKTVPFTVPFAPGNLQVQ